MYRQNILILCKNKDIIFVPSRQMKLTFGICCKSPSNLCTPIFGFALKASNIVCTFCLVESETLWPWPFDSSALPDWNTWLTEPPILVYWQVFDMTDLYLQRARYARSGCRRGTYGENWLKEILGLIHFRRDLDKICQFGVILGYIQLTVRVWRKWGTLSFC